MNNKVKGDYAWLALVLGIIAYDVIAIKTNKVETMSTAVWRSLKHPMKSPLAMGAWAILTYHLFINKEARVSIQELFNTIIKDMI